MSEKSVSVRLSANIAAYKSAMLDASKSTSDVAKATDETTSQVGSKWSNAGSKISGSMALAYGAMGTSAGLAVKYAIDAASNLEESINAVKVSYGESAEAIHKLGQNSVDSFGLSQRAFNEAAVSFTSFAEDVAGDGGDVAGTLNDLMLRSTDFASVMNIDVTQAAGAFKSALSGEAEPLKAFGINISDAAVKAYALERGLIKVGGTMTDQQKVQARYGLIMQETSKVAGDFANTSDGYANSMRKAKAEVENIAASMGKALLPMLASSLNGVMDLVDGFKMLSNLPPVKILVEITGEESLPGALDKILGFSAGIPGMQTGIDMVTGAISKFNSATRMTDEELRVLLSTQTNYTAGTKLVTDAIDAAVASQKFNNSQLKYSDDSYTLVTASINDAIDAHKAETDALNEASDARRTLTDDTYAAADAEDAWWEQLAETTAALKDGTVSERDKAKSTRDLATATDEVVTAQLTANGVNVDTVAGQSAWLSAMMETTRGLSGPMRSEVLNYVSLVSGIPTEKLTAILADLDEGSVANAGEALNALSAPREVQIRPRIMAANGSFPTGISPVARAGGGPTLAGHLYEVGESNVAEMFMSGGRQYMIPGNNGNVIPGSQLTPAPAVASSGWGGAGDTLTVVIEGQPMTAIVQRREAAQVAELRAGMR